MFHCPTYSQYLKGIQDNEHHKFLVHIANSISYSIKFHQSYVDQISSKPVVIDVLEFATKEEIQAWSKMIDFGISVGYTLIRNNVMKSTVLKRADNAMYTVNEKERGNIEFL